MRVTFITDRDGTIRGMAYCQFIDGDKRYLDEVEISASPVKVGTATRSASDKADTAEEFESHTVDLPQHLVGKGIEDLRQLAYIDFSGDSPMLRLRAKPKGRKI